MSVTVNVNVPTVVVDSPMIWVSQAARPNVPDVSVELALVSVQS